MTPHPKSNPFEGLYQDAEGTIPVTAVGQRVGLFVAPPCGTVVQHDQERKPRAVEFGAAFVPHAEEGKP